MKIPSNGESWLFYTNIPQPSVHALSSEFDRVMISSLLYLARFLVILLEHKTIYHIVFPLIFPSFFAGELVVNTTELYIDQFGSLRASDLLRHPNVIWRTCLWLGGVAVFWLEDCFKFSFVNVKQIILFFSIFNFIKCCCNFSTVSFWELPVIK